MAEIALAKPVHHDFYAFISLEGQLKDAAAGRLVLITGGGSGIGKATAEAFAQASAKTVVIVGRRLQVLENVRAEIENKYPACHVVAESVDVTSEKQVDDLFERLKTQSIEIDVLMNNAGLNSYIGTIKDANVEDWWTNFVIMLKGPLIMTRAFLRSRQETARPAAIIMTSSIGSYNRGPKFSSYASVKAALNRFTEWVASENKDQGVQAVAFHPGGVANTDLTSKSPEWMLQYYTETAELGAGTAVFLSTERAKWLIGRYVDARWDLEELEKSKDRIEHEDLLKMSLLGHVRVPV